MTERRNTIPLAACSPDDPGDSMGTITVEEYRNLQADAMPEKRLQAEVEKIARSLNWYVYHTWNSQHSEAGFPDLVMLRDGRMIVAELKREGKQPTGPQKRWLDQFRLLEADTFRFEFRPRPIEVHIWRPSQLIDGTIHRILEAA